MFIKYSEIENSYQQKHIDREFQYNPLLKECRYGVFEKLDGSNLQFIIYPGNYTFDDMMDSFEIASRSNKLNKESNFQGASLPELIKKYTPAIKQLQIYANDANVMLNVYGELYGYGIQKRINYGKEKYLTFFDMRVNGEYLAQKDFCGIMDHIEYLTSMNNLYVKPVHIYSSLEEALTINPDFESAFSPTNDHAEGWVIKPWNITSSFYLKMKSEKFKEKTKVREIKNKDYSITVNKLKAYFNTLINENRVLSVFSKEGEISEPSQIGDYVK
jgi:Rnl2 family RNA ligase